MLDCPAFHPRSLVVLFDWLPHASPYVLAALPVVILVAYTVFGATGFGSSIIAVPALAHAFPLTFAVPLTTTLDCVATTTATYRQWRRAEWREIRRILPTMLLGMLAGTTILVRLPRAPALLALGVFAASYGLYALAGRQPRAAIHGAWAWPIGFVGGLLSALFGTGGPIYIVYLASRIDDKSALRATSSALIAISVGIREVVFAGSGLLTAPALLATAALMLPLVLLGYWAGNRLHHALSRRGVMRLIAVLLLANGILLVARAVEALG